MTSGYNLREAQLLRDLVTLRDVVADVVELIALDCIDLAVFHRERRRRRAVARGDGRQAAA